MPARLLCNMCFAKSDPYLVKSNNCKMPLKHIVHSEALKSGGLIAQVWRSITETIRILLN